MLEFVEEATRRIDAAPQLYLTPGFVPSDYLQVYDALRTLATNCIAPGLNFCEWGSGFGVATCLANLAGFQSWGIEIEPSLVQQARQLAADYQFPVEFILDSFFPPNSECITDHYEPSLWLVTQPAGGGDAEPLLPSDFEVIFAFPGPDDDKVISRVFRRYVSMGAVLLTFHGREGMRLRRKVRHKRKFSKRIYA